MKHKIIKTILFSLIVFLLFGCASENKFNDEGLTFEYDSYLSSLENKFYFKQLNENQKKIYMCLYDASTRFENSFEYNFAYNEEDQNKAFNAFLVDWPQYFWWTSLDNTIDETKKNVTVTSVSEYLYFDTVKEDYENMNKLIDDVVNNIEGETDYDKVKVLHDYMIDNYNIYNDYFADLDYDSQEYYSSNNIYKLLKDKDGTYSSYAALFSLLANKLGFESYYVMPNTNSNCHNIIKLDDNYYYVDIGYDDEIAETSEYELDKYTFFLTNDEVELTHHDNDASYTFPSCTSSDYYFYNMAGKYFSKYDEKELDDYIVDCIKKKNKEIILVFNNVEDSESCYDHYFADKSKNFYDLYSKRIKTYYNISTSYYLNKDYYYVIFSYED